MSRIFASCFQKTLNLLAFEEPAEPRVNRVFHQATFYSKSNNEKQEPSHVNEQLKVKLIQNMQVIEQLMDNEQLLQMYNSVLRERLVALWKINETERSRSNDRISILENLVNDKNTQIHELWKVIDMLGDKIVQYSFQDNQENVNNELKSLEISAGNEDIKKRSRVPVGCGRTEEFNERLQLKTHNFFEGSKINFQEKRDSIGSSEDFTTVRI